MRRFLCVLSAGIVLSATAIGWAEDAKTADQKPGPEIRKLLADIEENFSRGDANGVAACWTPTGDFVGPAGDASPAAATSRRRLASSSPTTRTCR